MSIAGNLKTMQLGDLLQWCASNLKTGTLRLKKGPIEKALFFNEGRLFSSVSTSPRETLGQYLIRSGKISEEELFKALIQQDRQRQPLGQILVKAGSINDDELEHLLQLKTEESIFDCFLWSEGDFKFEEGQLPDHIPVSIPLDITGVILEGARRSDEWARIHEAFPSRLTTFRPLEKAAEEASQLSAANQRILQLVERGMNIAEIALELHAVEFYAAKRLLDMFNCQLIEIKDSAEEIAFDQQVESLRDKLREGVALYNAGDYDMALERFEQALELDSQNKYARLFVLKILRIQKDLEKVGEIELEAIPELKVELVDMAQLELDPQVGFVLSRVNGEWDIASIMKICPMNPQEVLIVFQRLLDEGLIELRTKDS